MNEAAITVKKKFDVSNFLLSYGFYILFVVMFIVCGIISPYFLTRDNLMQIMWGATTLLVVAAGGTSVIVTGNMDMSVGSVALCSSAIAVYAMNHGAGFVQMVILIFVVGAVIGAINGILVTYCKLNSMLATLGMMILLRGIALNITNGGAQTSLPPEFKMIADSRVFGISILILVSLIILLVFQCVLRKTRFGAYCYAIGCSEESAKRIGLPLKRVKMAVYILSGICAAFVGFVACCKVGTYSGTIGNEMEFDVVTVCVMGGTSLLGGRGNIFPGTFIGVVLLYLINNILALTGASPYIYPFAKGLVIFAAMYVDALKNFRKKRI
ncbi:ABC transporter permease [Ruminococcus sp. OA3]|uniref:ABC transporter permease n=1 Tax=Ruminococcus sp. OA3 TaxID=2914164 RepID=UPI001F056034|nr:ABC transporter permease [Ruminococcus sp. OA3]MCH1981551.1 ABC transporter permease [Ruminococcus sp. OA3]